MTKQSAYSHVVNPLFHCYVLTILMFGRCLTLPSCRHGYVKHDIDWYSTVCCKRTECEAGTYVKTCTENYGNDTCEVCPIGTMLLDSTNSDFVVECFPVPSCPEETVSVNYFSPTGCRLPCVCDVKRHRYGRDPCRCHYKRCPQHMFLTLAGTCSTTRPIEKIPEGVILISP